MSDYIFLQVNDSPSKKYSVTVTMVNQLSFSFWENTEVSGVNDKNIEVGLYC